MNKSSSIGAIDKTDLSEQTKKKTLPLKITLSKKLIKKNHAVKNYVNMFQL